MSVIAKSKGGQKDMLKGNGNRFFPSWERGKCWEELSDLMFQDSSLRFVSF